MCALETVTTMYQEFAQAYANSKVTIWSPTGKVIATQARAGDETSSGSISELLDAQELFVITAWNPESVELTAKENLRANQELLAELQGLGYKILRARGSSVDEAWFEDSFAAFASSAAIAGELEVHIHALAIKYRQNAYFKITADTLEVAGALYSDLRISMPLVLEWSSISDGNH